MNAIATIIYSGLCFFDIFLDTCKDLFMAAYLEVGHHRVDEGLDAQQLTNCFEILSEKSQQIKSVGPASR